MAEPRLDRDLRLAHARGALAQALAAQVTKAAHELAAAAYASAIWRNARLRARWRRRAQGARWRDGGHPRWLKRSRPDWWRRITWGEAFARGQLPQCYVEGKLLLIGKAAATAAQQQEIDWQIEDHRGDLPCCVCPSDAVGRCLTHWQLYHAGAARCFRCERHPAAGRGGFPGVVCGPLWEGRRSPGYAAAPAPPSPLVVVLP